MFLIIALFIVLLVPGWSLAQSIAGYSGTFEQGNSVIINGSSFGEKPEAVPVTWDNMETGQFNPLWQSTNALSIGTDSRHQNSSYCGTANMAGSGGERLAYFTGDNGTLGERWFVQYWFKLDTNFDWGTTGYGEDDANLANVKIFRMWNPGRVTENFHLNQHGWDRGFPYYTENVSDARGGSFSQRWNTWSKGEWHCLQFEFKESSMGGNDGVFRGWFDCAVGADNTEIMTREDFPQYKRPFIIGFYNAWGDTGTDRDDFYIDDVYIDNTWARVELGDSSDYDFCTHREIQVPSAWSSDTITVSANVGSLGGVDELYLFVTDHDGNVSDGFLVSGVFDGPGQPGTPIREQN